MTGQIISLERVQKFSVPLMNVKKKKRGFFAALWHLEVMNGYEAPKVYLVGFGSSLTLFWMTLVVGYGLFGTIFLIFVFSIMSSRFLGVV